MLALIDDIATVLDDVAVMTKVAAKKTAGVLGDDLALNAQQVSGVNADRELPVVWAVAKGSFINKLILVPAALLISMLVPWLVTPLLMLGGAFLCFEGFEKLAHRFLHSKEEDQAEHEALIRAVSDPAVDLLAFEKEKIKGAVRTDFILSAEIIVIALGTVQNSSFLMQTAVVGGVAVLMTVGVYSLVAGIVKLDDAGLYLTRSASSALRALGNGLLWIAPRLMKGLAVLGTAAMFLVGGGILLHGLPHGHEILHHVEQQALSFSGVGPVLAALSAPLVNALAGVLAGAMALCLVSIVSRFMRRPAAAA